MLIRMPLMISLPFLALIVLFQAPGAWPISGPEPAARGRVWTADGGATLSLRVRVLAEEGERWSWVQPSGEFIVPAKEGRPVELVFEEIGPGEPRYHPARVRTDSATVTELRVVLIPREWVVAAGRHAGRRIPISPELAFRPVCEGCSAFFRRAGRTGEMRDDRIRTWAERAFPLGLAFDHEYTRLPIASSDSMAFWEGPQMLEEWLGEALFRALAWQEATRRTAETESGVVFVQIDPRIAPSALGLSSAHGEQLTYGEVRFRRPELMRGARGPTIVAHELIHILGLGHTCSWRSIMAPADRCPGLASPVPTAHDAAYIELARRVGELQRARGGAWALWSARENGPAEVPLGEIRYSGIAGSAH